MHLIIKDIIILKPQKIIKWHLSLLMICLLVISLPIPAHAGKFKILITPNFLRSASTATLNARSPDSVESVADIGIAFDFGNDRHSFALDYYDISSTYKYRTSRRLTEETARTPVNFEDTLRTTGVFMGYRRRNKNGFYIGGGGMYITPKVSRQGEVLEGDRRGEPISNNFDFEPVVAPTLVLGHDFAFKSGFLLGSHFVGSWPVTSNDKKNDGVLKDLYMLSFSFGLGFNW